MVNTFERLIEEKHAWLMESQNLRSMPTTNAVMRKLANIAIQLKKLNWKIKNFGQKHPIVKVTIVYENNSVQYYYLTGVTQSEAISYYQYHRPKNVKEMHATTVPLNQAQII